MVRNCLVVLAACLAPAVSDAQELVKIVSWNGEELFTPASVTARAADLEKFGEQVKPDILLLLELNSLAVAEAVRDRMGLTGYHAVCSDFNPDGNEHASFEVAILSKFPLVNVVEFDRSDDGKGPEGGTSEKRLERVELPGIADTGVGRGFLYAEAQGKDLGLVVTHLKSSNGKIGNPDRENAQKRELVAAAIAAFVAEKRAANPKLTVLVGGDFNVGETDAQKNGKDLADDQTSGVGDRYDETHALLSQGLVGGLRMTSLTGDLGFETYVGDLFPGTGPIDCLYVAGPRQRDFTRAQATESSYGSDHRAVITHLAFLQHPPLVGGGAAGGTLRLARILPNPEGSAAVEAEKEAAWIKNPGGAPVNLSGWKLRDRAGLTWALSGTVAAGGEKEVRRNGMRMAMGNDGDQIELVDPDGDVVDAIEYGRVGEGVIVPHP